jgi:4-azaleucine resistance transporter AzlC
MRRDGERITGCTSAVSGDRRRRRVFWDDAMPSPLEFFSGAKRNCRPARYFPFRILYGVLALDAGCRPGIAVSSIVFAGSSQVIATGLFKRSPAIVIILTTLVINLRHVLYSTSVAPHVKHLSRVWKWLLAYLLTDEAYAVAITHYNREGEATYKHWYFLGAGLILWANWQASTAIGIFVGTKIPGSWGLDFTVALTFIALVVPLLKDRPSVAAFVTAGIAAVAGAGLQYKLGLIAAAFIGIGVGLWLETRQAGALHLRPTPASKAQYE